VSDAEGPFERKRPKGLTRRDFVRTTVGAAAFGAAAGVGYAAFSGVARPADLGPRFDYLGVRVLDDSKAPQGLPLIPVRVDDEGRLEGEPRHLEWYRYCSRNEAPGLLDSYSGDSLFRYHVPSARVTEAEELGTWYLGRHGQVARADDFPGDGEGAVVSWRSQGQDDSNFVGAIVIKVDPEGFEDRVRQEYVSDGFLGVIGLCAHLCCAPVYRLGTTGYHEGHWDDIVCDCHGSWYDPRTVETYRFPPTR
jgi:Rieske Fe-S protein